MGGRGEVGIETYDGPERGAAFFRPLPQHPSQPALKLERLSSSGEKSGRERKISLQQQLRASERPPE